jgi:hypothetical protein
MGPAFSDLSPASQPLHLQLAVTKWFSPWAGEKHAVLACEGFQLARFWLKPSPQAFYLFTYFWYLVFELRTLFEPHPSPFCF